MSDSQLTLFDVMPEKIDVTLTQKLKIVNAQFVGEKETDWKNLFSGYDELYGITFSSGIHFMEKVMDMFSHVEMIFGCEGVISNDVAAILAMEAKSVSLIAKSKSARRMAERMEKGEMVLSVSRDTKSHEKIFILRSNDGRTRVITGSGNMSASAFCGLQREDIVCFDDIEAYKYYKERFDSFQEQCSDNINHKVILSTIENNDYLHDNVGEIPIIKEVDKKQIIILEQSDDVENDECEIIADIKGLEDEMKPLLPKAKKDEGRILLTNEITKAFKRKYKEASELKKVKERNLPKLHLDYDNSKMFFNGKEMNLLPDSGLVKTDIQCVINYLASLSSFYGSWEQCQRDYYAFMNWYFASAFMPYLRYIGSKNNYGVIPFPVFGILYGDSNGGKSTFVRLLSKLMCGVKLPFNSSSDFTSTNIEKLKRACEGVPINVDDLAKEQYNAHYEKVIKDDDWGIPEGFINYPAITISTNKLPSLKSDITKRTVAFYIGIKLDKETGAKNSKRINESMRQATTALYCTYVSKMFNKIKKMVEQMKIGEEEYFPDIFELSSDVLYEIFTEHVGELPAYITKLTYSDYFGDKAVGKNAMKKIMLAWENNKKDFKIDKKKNTLMYAYDNDGKNYELRYLQQELPPVLNAQVIGNSLVMELDKASEVFDTRFRKRLWE